MTDSICLSRLILIDITVIYLQIMTTFTVEHHLTVFHGQLYVMGMKTVLIQSMMRHFIVKTRAPSLVSNTDHVEV